MQTKSEERIVDWQFAQEQIFFVSHMSMLETAEECELVFKENDSILIPNIFQVLKAFIKAKGKPQTAIELLGSSYKGFPHMINLICSWMMYVTSLF